MLAPQEANEPLSSLRDGWMATGNSPRTSSAAAPGPAHRGQAELLAALIKRHAILAPFGPLLRGGVIEHGSHAGLAVHIAPSPRPRPLSGSRGRGGVLCAPATRGA